MALLYEHSAVWRAIVKATRNPRVLVAFSAAMCGAAYALSSGSRLVTDRAAANAKKDVEEILRKDKEAARYAKHSKEALAAMFEHVRGEQESNDDDSALNTVATVEGAKLPTTGTVVRGIKLPAVAWHPGAERRDREKKEKLKSQAEAKIKTEVEIASSEGSVSGKGKT